MLFNPQIYGFGNLMINLVIAHTLGLIVLLVASYTDIKTREVPDWLNFGLIGAGFGINLIFSILFFEVSFIIASIVGFITMFAVAWLMFYTGQWGGGDSKILMGLGALVGVDLFAKTFPFLAGFFINAMLVGALYGILWSIFLVLKNKEKFIQTFRKYYVKKGLIIARKIVSVIFLLLAIAAFLIPDKFAKLMLFYLAVISIVSFYLWIAIKAVETSCMLKYVNPQKLTEGDWIAREIKVGGKYITGPKDLGIEKKQINKLIQLHKKNRIGKILIKEGIPFVPSFFIAYIITLIYGNLVFLFI
jgi:Flp pilus assembly protein protease CpaA